MSTQKDMADARKLMSRFDSKYKAKYKTKYLGNSHSDVWGFRTMNDDLGFDSSCEVIDYYFKTKPQRGHKRDHLLYNYHHYMQALRQNKRRVRSESKILKRMKEEFGES